jgi:hypothetical protein
METRDRILELIQDLSPSNIPYREFDIQFIREKGYLDLKSKE